MGREGLYAVLRGWRWGCGVGVASAAVDVVVGLDGEGVAGGVAYDR